ncbi:helix-turn-helix transcriptional regulator [Clostridium botulinum]|uniref:helix-turn-helix domain-containing protein n=1 Tax=Clostridium botulinum TaxID=1491 RepID=UPI00174E0E96|nr:helix-turn-helix transcriptional regulator [Clostridium botulinum]MBD5642728.1 helix-turn-helix transcriptional regulator [Clostridium botulinum]
MDSNKLKGRMVEKRYTQKILAEELGITPQALNAKINKRSQFTLDEVVKLTAILEIEDPIRIFFTTLVPNKQQEKKLN